MSEVIFLKTEYCKRIWAEIDLDAITYNVHILRKPLPQSVKMLAIIKANAYGHGVEGVAHALANAGVDYLGVSSISEAIQVRRYEADLPILILGYTPPECACALMEHRLIQAVYSLPYARQLSEAAKAAGGKVLSHLKLDVGMGRLGFRADDENSMEEAVTACGLDGLQFEGILTHLPSADYDGDPDGSITAEQIQLFIQQVEKLEEKGIHFAVRHCCNSAGGMVQPAGHLDLVREGIALYGLYPASCLEDKVDLHPAMTLKTVVAMVKTLKPGDSLGYGRTEILEKERRVATVCIGYADGYPRALSRKGYMLVNGKIAPILGRICMDQMMLDVTEIPDVEMGTEVTVFGQGLPAEEIADLCGTNHYELVCAVGKRVPRVYYQNGAVVSVADYLGES